MPSSFKNSFFIKWSKRKLKSSYLFILQSSFPCIVSIVCIYFRMDCFWCWSYPFFLGASVLIVLFGAPFITMLFLIFIELGTRLVRWLEAKLTALIYAKVKDTTKTLAVKGALKAKDFTLNQVKKDNEKEKVSDDYDEPEKRRGIVSRIITLDILQWLFGLGSGCGYGWLDENGKPYSQSIFSLFKVYGRRPFGIVKNFYLIDSVKTYGEVIEWTPLMYAHAIGGREKVISYMVCEAQADPKYKDITGKTARDIGLFLNRFDLTAYLDFSVNYLVEYDKALDKKKKDE